VNEILIRQEIICGSLGKLICWLETWCDDQGAYNGFVVHRTETKRMSQIHDTAWSQASVIRGYGNLFRKSSESRWRQRMEKAVTLFVSRYDAETGRIIHTGHEDERFQSLVSCALGISALFSIIDLVDDQKRKEYISLASDHIYRYWIKVLWVESEGAFKFSEMDYYSPGEDRFVVNFNAIAAEALLAVFKETGQEELREKAVQVGKWLIKRWKQNQLENAKLLAGHTTISEDSSSDWMPQGGFSYQYSASKQSPDNYVTLYAGLSLRGFNSLYEVTGDKNFVEMIHAQSSYVLSMRDPVTCLFYHTAKRGRIERNPQFIAGAGMVLVGLHCVKSLIGEQAIPYDTIRSILGRVHSNGSYPGFIGKNDTGLPRRDGGGIVWEDSVASVNWNAQWFEYLTLLVKEPEDIDLNSMIRDGSVSVLTKRFFYRDTYKRVQIISWWPPRSWGIFFYKKPSPIAKIAVYPVQIYWSIRKWLRDRFK
jgi:hypothetical protein